MPPVLIGVTTKLVGASATVPKTGVADTAAEAQEVPTEFMALIFIL
jgi:hypothetical protein